MTITAVTFPVPTNNNLDRSMFVWCGAAGSAGDPLATDAKIQSLLNLCSSKGVNLLFLDIWGYLGGSNWSVAHIGTMQKFIHYAHASGIRVYALAGNTDWGSNQQWVMNNIIRHIFSYNVISDSVTNATSCGGSFDGLIFDDEYWTVPGYTSVDPIGLCDLMNASRRILSLPVGCFATQWLADPNSLALSFSYNNGPIQLEGLNIIDNADFVAVACYNNQSSTQITMFQNWFDHASATGNKANFGLFCGSETGQGLGNQSYWTGQSGALSAMEVSHTAISNAFTLSPNTNCSFRGQCIDPYSSYSQMV